MCVLINSMIQCDILNKYNNIYCSTIAMKPVDVEPSKYIDSSKDINEKDPKFKIGDIVRTSKCKNIFAKGETPNWFEQVFVIKNVKIFMLLMILMVKKLLEPFMKKRIAKNKSVQKNEFRIEQVIKRKGDKLYAKWKGYNNSFNSWVDKKGIV